MGKRQLSHLVFIYLMINSTVLRIVIATTSAAKSGVGLNAMLTAAYGVNSL